jgi:hypothetical protein
MAGELARPGVEVIQAFRKASPTILRPTLVPMVVGPAFEVVKILTKDGTINAKALYGAYTQVGKAITHSGFPDSRGNIDELTIQPDSIRPFLLSGGKLNELPMNPGEGFFAASHEATRAALRATGTTFNVGGKSLVMAIDQTSRTSTGKDVTVAFPGADSSSLTAQQVVDTLNSAFGNPVASLVKNSSGVTTGVQIASLSFGATSSVTIRAGGSANHALGLGWNAASDPAAGIEERVEGSGYRAENPSTGTASPWVQFYPGDYLRGPNGTSSTFVDGRTALIDVFGVVKMDGPKNGITFGPGNTVDLQAGDQIFCDGLRLKDGEVMLVEQDRFKVGTINQALSTADAQGRFTKKVYDAVALGTINDMAPFAPRYVWFKATGLDPKKLSPTAASIAGSPEGNPNEAEAAQVASETAITGPFAIQGQRLHYVVTIDGVDTDGWFTFTGGPYADAAALKVAIGTDGIHGVVPTAPTSGADSGKLVLATTAKGRLQGIRIKADGDVNASLGFSTTQDTFSVGKDVEYSDLAAKSLDFQFDNNPHIYSVGFTADSLDLAIDSINTMVGATVASKGGNNNDRLVLTSFYAGAASMVTVLDTSTALGNLGFSGGATAEGSGRPLPDAYMDDVGNLVIGSELLRDPVTGFPLDQTYSASQLYIEYTALRKDVTAVAKVAGVLRLSDIDTLTAVLDPVTEENPLALAAYLCMVNCPNFEIKALGVDEVTGSAPEGTELAYARAAGLLEAEEVYAIAPLTQSEAVHGIFQTHVTLMSQPEQSGERILLQNQKMPTRKISQVAGSGISANSNGNTNQLALDGVPSQGLIGLIPNPAGPFKATDGVYVEFSFEGVLQRYNVASCSGSLVSLRTSFAAGENDDYFYTISTLPSGVLNAAWSLKVRGPELKIPGSNPARLDYSLVADTVAEASGSIGNRRVYNVFPDTVGTTIDGLNKSLPGYYACAAYAGLCAGQPPQQGFTNFPLTGITSISGTEKFSKKQLNRMAGGGTFIMLQEVQGGAVTCRHQLSTDVTSVETRELSVTKVVDFAAKLLRTGIRRFIGRQNISPIFLDTLGTAIQGMLQFLVEQGILNGANLNNIIQDPKAPDTVLIDVTLSVPFPCNYIRLTLVV